MTHQHNKRMQTKNHISPRLLLAAILAIAAFGMARGQGGAFTPAENIAPAHTYNMYAIYDTGTRTVSASFYDKLGQIAADLGKGTAADLINSLYIRWFVANADGGYAPVENMAEAWAISLPFYETANVGGYGKIWWKGKGTSESWLDAYNADNQKKISSANLTFSGQGEAGACRVVCLLSTQAPKQNGYTHEPTWAITGDPDNIEAAVSFEIITEEQAQNMFTPGGEGNATTYEKTQLLESFPTSPTVNLLQDYRNLPTEMGGNMQECYIRWYIADAEGNNVFAAGSIGHKQAATDYKEISAGMVYNSATAENKLGDQWNPTNWGNLDIFLNNITASSLQEGYSIVCLIADKTPETAGDYVLKEPDFKLKYIYSYRAVPTDFKHYKGYSGSDFDEKGRQQVHSWTYSIYVKPGERITLELPITERDVLEPAGYFRWYNYDTDLASGNIDNSQWGKDLKHYPTTGESRGLMIWNQNLSCKETSAAVDYVAPAEGWTGETIACDVSRYIDGLDETRQYLLHEPTLSMRYIFNIRPAADIANAIKTAILSGPQNVLEDQGNISMGAYGRGSTTNLRVEFHDVGDYYFYNYVYSNKIVPEGHETTESDFGTELIKATRIRWFVYDETGRLSKELTTNLIDNGRMASISLDNLSGYFSKLDGESWESEQITYDIGHVAYIVAYAADAGSNMCPVAKFNCRFISDSYPMTVEEVPAYRRVSFLDTKYTKVAEITFDNDCEGTSLAAPTNPLDNMTQLPSAWNRRYYGFVYPGLYAYYDKASASFQGLSPGHGEYGLYKSINVDGVSKGGAQWGDTYYKFQWWANNQLRDRTYTLTGGAQSGYFLYVDASDESRPIASVEFEGNLCVGSTIVLSAAVADMTTQSTKPQVIFKLYGVETNAYGNITSRKLIHSFASGDFNTVNASKTGEWYQVYTRVTLQQGTGVENYSKFLVSIDNFCNGTQGADYAVDDIRIYASNAKVETLQERPACDDSQPGGATVRLRAKHESLVALLNIFEVWESKPIYYRICKADGTPLTGVYGGEAAEEYGTATIVRYPRNADGTLKDGYELVGGEVYAILADRDFGLAPGEEYYVSVALPMGEEGDYRPGNWGMPDDVCSVYSDYFTLLAQELEIHDATATVNPEIILPCNGVETTSVELTASLKVPDPDNGGMVAAQGVKFDWFIGTLEEYNEAAARNGTRLREALETFRQAYPSDAVASCEQNATGTYTEAHKAALREFVNGGRLHLAAEKISRGVTKADALHGSLDLCLIPVTASVTIGGKAVALCLEPAAMSLRVRVSSPELTLGFADVQYLNGATRSVRAGLGQLAAIGGGKALRLPVNGYKNMDGNGSATFSLAVYDDDNAVTVSATNDPTWSTATAAPLGIVTEIAADHVDLALAEEVAAGLHEGYWYELNFRFHDAAHTAGLQQGQEACLGDVFLTLKVVPEFITWTARADNDGSSNWNNDANWTRSTKAELYKADYTDYGEGDFALLAQQPSYAPMKFTKVTVQAGVRPPLLAEATTHANGIIREESLVNSDFFTATDGIEYDLMVKTEPEDGRYECEKFYANTCGQIYFKPGAELRNQHYLTYGTAWVEKELRPGTWNLLASPLRGVYSGDMYVPKANGRQETEAFMPISFNNPSYGRSEYPIYQRSWDRAESMVITPQGDARGDYGAAIDWAWDGAAQEATVIQTHWSHNYNEADVKYWNGADGGLNGFMIKAGRDGTAYPQDALLRLPKGDTTYYYYSHDGQADGQATGPLDRSGNGRLLLDNGNADGYGTVRQPMANESDGNGLYIVGNPYMCSIDMEGFFGLNTQLEKKYWTISGGTVTAHTAGDLGTLPPMQAFFVKKAEGEPADEVTFIANMATRQATAHTRARRATKATCTLRLTAEGGGAEATVLLADGAEAGFADSEDAELLTYDADGARPAPYTVAGAQAVSVNMLPEIGMLPVGITGGNGGTTRLSVSVEGNTGATLLLYDAKGGSTTPLADGTALTLCGNEHGRYFITTRSALAAGKATPASRCYSPGRGLVTVAAAGGIERVAVYSLGGAKVADHALHGAAYATLAAGPGVCIVVVETTGGKQETHKLQVR